MAKGVGILLMVWGHISSTSRLTHWLYFFHMPLFMLLSGYVLNIKNTYRDFLWKRVRSLIVPYMVFFVISFILEWLYQFLFYAGHPLMPTFWRKALEICCPSYGTGIAGSLWFLIALFWLNMFWGGLHVLHCPPWGMIIMTMAFNVVIYHYQPTIPFFLAQTALLSPFFVLGHIFRGLDIHKILANRQVCVIIALIGGGYYIDCDKMASSN